MANKVVSLELAAELRRLCTEYPVAVARAVEALRTDPPGHELAGKAIQRFLAEEERVAKIVQRIRQIQGAD
jgi:hypothetical protein